MEQQSVKKSTQFSSAKKPPLRSTSNKNKSSAIAQQRSSSVHKLYEDHIVRKEKQDKIKEIIDKTRINEANMRKSNKNAHTLALVKLEKDLKRILRNMAQKCFKEDED